MMLLVAIVALLASCNSEKLAKEMTGTWTSEYNVIGEDGEPDRIAVLFSFQYQPSGDNDGTFTEIRSGSYSDGISSISYQTFVKGTYAIGFGNAFLEYDLSSIGVSTRASVRNVFHDALDWASNQEWRSATAKIGQGAENEFRQLISQSLREEYNDCNDILYTLDDVEIKGKVLKCESEIYGPLVMHKIDLSGDAVDETEEQDDESE